MGQYYNAVVEIKGRKEVYYHMVDKKYMMAKLLEHGYYNNPFVLAITSKFWRKKGKLAWVGDYAEPEDFNWNEAFENAHSDDAKENLKYNGFRLEGKLFVNHTKKMIIDLDDYKELLKEQDMIISPIPLLTAVGNDKGGGDFHRGTGIGYELIGTWAWDEIEITDDDEQFYEFKYEEGKWNKIPKTDYVDVTKDYLFIETR